MPDDDLPPKRPGRMWPGGPGLFIGLCVIVAFAALFAGLALVTSLLWLGISVAVIATVLAVYRWRRHRTSKS